MSDQRAILTEIQDFLIEVPEIKSKGEIIALGLFVVALGLWSTMPSLYLVIVGLVILFVGVKRKAVKHACLAWADICEKYIAEEYGFEWHMHSKCFYKNGADILKDHEIPIYHNPQNDDCWDGDKPLFNMTKWGDTSTNKIMPDFYSQAESCLSFTDILMLGILKSEQHFKSKVVQKSPFGFPKAIYLSRTKDA
jgi:hypothetical protein